MLHFSDSLIVWDPPKPIMSLSCLDIFGLQLIGCASPACNPFLHHYIVCWVKFCFRFFFVFFFTLLQISGIFLNIMDPDWFKLVDSNLIVRLKNKNSKIKSRLMFIPLFSSILLIDEFLHVHVLFFSQLYFDTICFPVFAIRFLFLTISTRSTSLPSFPACVWLLPPLLSPPKPASAVGHSGTGALQEVDGATLLP